MNYLLDTDTVSFAMRGEGAVGDHIRGHHPSALAISAVTMAELRYGADLQRSNRLHRLIDAFARGVRVLPFDEPAALRFGVLTAALVRQGQPIGHFDCLIAAHALAAGLILVTHNRAHYGRIRGLKTEDWYS